VYISDVFFVPYCYRSARLSYIGIVASVAFKLVYTAGVGGLYTCTLVADILYWWAEKLSSGSFV
jgi:hypothetical protein